MKRVFRGVLTGVCIAVLAASIGTTTVFAAGPGSGSRFVDANGDGVCDNYAAGARPQDGTGCANGFGGGRGR